MLDVSFAGGFVTIDAPAIGTTIIDEFSDEGSPIEVDEIEVTGHLIDVNGIPFFWRKPSAYYVRVSVVPNTKADKSLSKLLSVANPLSFTSFVSDDDLDVSLKVAFPECSGGYGGWEFSEGRIAGGHAGASLDSAGRMRGKNFSFVFGDFK